MDVGRLRKIPVFADVSDDDLRRIATFATEDSAPAGTTLVREGDYSTELIAIEEGTAEVRHDGRLLASLGPGDVFGETGVLEGGLRNASVVATSPLRIVKLTTWDIKRLTPETVQRLRELVAQRQPAVEPDGAPPAA
ncbi:MAG TPA: cyclic nucleotide-binding domain-containing protein [Solirubrobacteraceae bacterium]|jgi:CRP-like cAMP-binding protein|nr:cyclic nucleotide-binding domain-containing protein [Solirubrobacteraceae bacterium]